MAGDYEPITLNEILQRDGFDPAKIVVFRHKPWEPDLNKAFDWIVSERRDLFDSYQSTHSPNTEAALKRADYVVSCIRYKPKRAMFVGLYSIDSQREISVDEYQNRPLHRELMTHGLGGHKASDGRDHVVEFTMSDTGWRSEWSERLVIGWPGLERSWYRWGDRNVFPIKAIAEESLLSEPIPTAQELSLSWHELTVIPKAWRAALRQWRGVYLITDRSDRMAYVGSAGGSENLLQRWIDYAKSGHGGNKLLRGRDPANFVFSILQRVSPDMPSDELVAIENGWKIRLRTRSPDGLNEN